MSKEPKIRKMATTFALAVSVLAPAGMVIGNAAPASAQNSSAVFSLGKLGRVETTGGIPLTTPIIGIAEPEPEAALLLPAVQAAREAARR